MLAVSKLTHPGNDECAKCTEGYSEMSPVDVNNAKICLLDDDSLFLEATDRLLVSVGLRTEQFTDPHVFLEYARTCQPRLAVIDICMPTMNGLELQEHLRTASPSTQIIVLTARDDHSVRMRAMAQGALAFFLKAGNEDALLAQIRALFSAS